MNVLETIAQNTPLLLAVGIGGVLIGSYLVSQGAALAMSRWSLSPSLIGLFLAAVGTLPELAVTLQAAAPLAFQQLDPHEAARAILRGAELPLGLILGSSLINVMVLTAVGAFFLSVLQGRKLFASKLLLGRDMLALLIAIGIILFFAFQGASAQDPREYFSQFATFLLAAAGGYMLVSVMIEMVKGPETNDAAMFALRATPPPALLIFLTLGGALFLFGSSWILVSGIDEFVHMAYGTTLNNAGRVTPADQADYARFGLFWIAACVAAPELIMMLVNVVRRDSASIAVTSSTLISSTIFNLLFVLGIAFLLISHGDIIDFFRIQPFIGDFIFLGVGILALALFLVNDLWAREEQGILSVNEALTLIALYILYAFYRHGFFDGPIHTGCEFSRSMGFDACGAITGLAGGLAFF